MDARSLLDELMGSDRDLPLDQKKKTKLRFDDPEVCHYNLAAFCPHDLFPNTKSDLGPCPKVHDDRLKVDYLKSNKVAAYEGELHNCLDRLIQDLDRRIRRSHERLDKEIPLAEIGKQHSDRITAIAVECAALLKQAEEEGEEGAVDKAEATMAKVEILNKEKHALVRSVVPEFALSTVFDKEKKMVVCDVCGAMQANTDTDKRLASHLDGKQHLGYFRIREMAAQLKEKREKESEARRKENGTARDAPVEGGAAIKAAAESEGKEEKSVERQGRDREPERDTRVDLSKAEERGRERRGEREKESNDSDRDRTKERDRDRDRPREKDRDRERDRERERNGGKDRERDGRREREQDRRREERERDRDGGSDKERGQRRERDRSKERERGGDRQKERGRDGERGSERRNSRH